MVTLSNDDKIKIYLSKLNLEMSYNTKLNSLLETDDNSGINVQFKFNDKKALGVLNGKPWMIDINKYDWETCIRNNRLNDTEENNVTEESSENIFHNIGNQFIAQMENGNEFIKKNIFSSLVNFNEEQNGCDMTKSLSNEDEIILEAFNNIANSKQNEIISYNTKLESLKWEDWKVN